MALEHEAPGLVQPPEHRGAGLEDEVEPSPRVHEGQSRVERQVDVAVRFVTGLPERAERAADDPLDGVLGHERACLGLVDEDRPAAVLQRPDAVQHHAVERHAGRRAARDREPTEQRAARSEELHAFQGGRLVGHDEGPVRRRGEGGGLEDSAVLPADLHDLP